VEPPLLTEKERERGRKSGGARGGRGEARVFLDGTEGKLWRGK
jgi:hypothetical protein